MKQLIESKVVTDKKIDLDRVKIRTDGVANHSHDCRGCSAGKAHRTRFGDHLNSRLRAPASHPLARVTADLAGPYPTESIGGARYLLVIYDEYTEMGFVDFLAHKSDATKAIIKWCRQARTRHNRNVVTFHTDGGGEFINDELTKYFTSRGTTHTHTTPHTSQHNGKAERLIRTLNEWSNAALIHCGAPKAFWSHAIDTVMYTRNLTHLCANDASNSDAPRTAFARWFGVTTPTPIDHLRVFGCDADVTHVTG